MSQKHCPAFFLWKTLNMILRSKNNKLQSFIPQKSFLLDLKGPFAKTKLPIVILTRRNVQKQMARTTHGLSSMMIWITQVGLIYSYEQTKPKPKTTLFSSAKRFTPNVYNQKQTQKIIAVIRSMLLPHPAKKRLWKTINLCYPLLVSLSRTMILIYRLCIGFPNSIKIHTNNVSQLDLKMYHQTSFKTFLYLQLSKRVQSPTTTLVTPVVVLIQCGKFERSFGDNQCKTIIRI